MRGLIRCQQLKTKAGGRGSLERELLIRVKVVGKVKQ